MIWAYDITQQMEETSPKATQLKTVLRPFQWLLNNFVVCMYSRAPDWKKIWRDELCLPGFKAL